MKDNLFIKGAKKCDLNENEKLNSGDEITAFVDFKRKPRTFSLAIKGITQPRFITDIPNRVKFIVWFLYFTKINSNFCLIITLLSYVYNYSLFLDIRMTNGKSFHWMREIMKLIWVQLKGNNSININDYIYCWYLILIHTLYIYMEILLIRIKNCFDIPNKFLLYK